MEPLQYLVTRISHRDAEAFSALPDAPVRAVAGPAHRSWSPRMRLAAALHRLADAVAPQPAGGRRVRAYAGGQGC